MGITILKMVIICHFEFTKFILVGNCGIWPSVVATSEFCVITQNFENIGKSAANLWLKWRFPRGDPPLQKATIAKAKYNEKTTIRPTLWTKLINWLNIPKHKNNQLQLIQVMSYHSMSYWDPHLGRMGGLTGSKTCKIWGDITQLQTLISNISGTSQDFQNRKGMRSTAICHPPSWISDYFVMPWYQ